LLDDSIDHPERADSIRAAAMDQHWLVCRVLYCSDELVRLLRFWRVPYDRDADILQAGFFDELLFAFEVESFTWSSQIEYGAISVCGKLAISGLSRLAAGCNTLVQAQNSRDIVFERLLNPIESISILRDR